MGKPSFPLPRGHFGDVALAPAQATRYKAIAQAQLRAALQAERANVLGAKRYVDTAKWKLAKTKNELRIYKSRARAFHGSASQAGSHGAQASMLSVGRMEGSLEDLIYGTYAKSYDEIKTTGAFLDMGLRDCAVLHTMELATASDPFHFLGIKWALIQLPGAIVVKPRDWCFLETMGIETDADGKRFGYVITHSVDVVGCPPFDRRYVVRGQASLSFIFREPVPGVVDIFAQGLFDPAGELIHQFSTLMTSEVLSGIFRTARCAEAKKLTILALRNNGGRMRSIDLSASSSRGVQRMCGTCRGSGSRFSSLKLCHICDATACSKCRVKKVIFVGAKHAIVAVSCCPNCIFQAREMQVRPAEPQFSILGEQFIAPEAVVYSSSGDDAASDSPGEPTPMHEKLVGGNREAEEEEEDESPKLSGMSEMDVERMIEAMLDQRIHDGKLNSTTTSATTASNNSSSNDLTAGSQTFAGNTAPPATTTTATTDMSTFSSSAVAVHDGAYATNISSDEICTLPPDQAEMYRKLLALQSAAHQVYELTRVNNELMLSQQP